MKKLATASLAILATALVAGSANAEPRWPNWYVGLHGGWNMDDDYDTNTGGVNGQVGTDGGFIVGASLGYVPPTEIPFFNMTRYELEYSFRQNDFETNGAGELEAHTGMVNMLIDFNNDSRWTPYVGGGLGMANIEMANEDDTTFAWQLMAGLEYAPETLPMTAWGVRYRYLGTNDPEFETLGVTTETEYDAHSIEASARFRF